MSNEDLNVECLTECLIQVHDAIVKNANGVLKLSDELTICEKITETLVSIHGEKIIERIE